MRRWRFSIYLQERDSWLVTLLRLHTYYFAQGGLSTPLSDDVHILLILGYRSYPLRTAGRFFSQPDGFFRLA